MEDSNLKKICLLFLTILTLLLTSCRQDTTQLAKDEFSKYYNGKDEVVLNIEDNLYFENYALDLNDLVKGNEHNNGLIINQRNFFFSASKENSMFNFTLNIFLFLYKKYVIAHVLYDFLAFLGNLHISS